METKKLIIASIVAGSISILFPSCEPETPVPNDPLLMDSIWQDPNDTTGTGGGGGTDDSTNTCPGDSTFYGGGTDTTGYGGGWGDTTGYGGGWGDTTGWGDSTNFGG